MLEQMKWEEVYSLWNYCNPTNPTGDPNLGVSKIKI